MEQRKEAVEEVERSGPEREDRFPNGAVGILCPRAEAGCAGGVRKELAPLRGETWLEPSAAFYLASMQQNPARDMAFSELFDRAPDKRFRMVQLFDNSATEEYITQAKSEKQRATLLVMRDLQHPGRALKDLERIAAWDPATSTFRCCSAGK